MPGIMLAFFATGRKSQCLLEDLWTVVIVLLQLVDVLIVVSVVFIRIYRWPVSLCGYLQKPMSISVDELKL